MYKKIGFVVVSLSLIAVPLLASASIPAIVCPHILRILSRGSRGDDVYQLQVFLNQQGYLQSRLLSGYFGPLTAAAVTKFQAREGLSQVGIVGPLTRAALTWRCEHPNKSFSASPTSGPAPLQVHFSAGRLHSTGTYIVYFGDGTNSGPLQIPSALCAGECAGLDTDHTYTSAGTYTADLGPSYYCPPNTLCMPPPTLGTVTITVTNSSTVGAPSISGVDGPTTLQVNHQGTWSVHVTDSSGYLSYSVHWGDEAPTPLMYGTSASAVVASSGTFTHTYATAGSYSPTFTVTNGNGQSASASATVVVGGATNPTFSVSPTSGSAPLAVTFSAGWANFPGGNYSIDFGDGTNDSLRVTLSSNPCPASGPCITAANGWAPHTYTSAGTYAARLATDPCPGMKCAARVDFLGTVTITVH